MAKQRNLIHDVMDEFERAKNFGLKEINWLPFKQACLRMYVQGQKSVKLDKVYAFKYAPSIQEGSRVTISLHFTREGAEKAMNEHISKEKEEWDEANKNRGYKEFDFGYDEDWYVDTIKIEE